MTDFIERRRPGWENLSRLLDRAGTRGSRLKYLSRDELRALGPLYRQAASDLAHARLREADPDLILYLNDLVLRAHGLVYAEQGPGRVRFLRFLSAGLPRLLRARGSYILAAAILFLLGGILGAGLTIQNRDNSYIFLGERAAETNFYKDLPKEITDGKRPEMAAFLMQNNIRVAIMAFAFGILGSVPTLVILFMNGLPIGALAVLQHHAGYDVILWSFLLPHGVPELSAIFISGGAGMLIGHALIAPGELTRRDALKVAGSDAIRLLFGATMLLIIAGFTESFVSPTALPAWIKFCYAALLATALTAYCRLGREGETDTNAMRPSLAFQAVQATSQ